jgi:hypothetical protein
MLIFTRGRPTTYEGIRAFGLSKAMAPRTKSPAPTRGRSKEVPDEPVEDWRQGKLKQETRAYLEFCDEFRARPDGSTIIALECGEHSSEACDWLEIPLVFCRMCRRFAASDTLTIGNSNRPWAAQESSFEPIQFMPLCYVLSSPYESSFRRPCGRAQLRRNIGPAYGTSTCPVPSWDR